MGKKIRIIADDAIPFLKGVLEPYADIEYFPGKSISSFEVKGADALLIRTRTHCDSKLLENSSVKMIATATIGMDHLDEKFLKSAKIEYSNAPGCNADSVCQYFVSALLEMCVKHKKKLRDLTLGVVGVGNIGSRIKRIGEILGLQVLCSDPFKQVSGLLKESLSFDDICAKSDIITFHTPLTFSGKYPTYHLFNENTLSTLKKSCFVFNASRGEVVEESALMEALDKGICLGAVIDVWENEPEINPNFIKKIDIGTPHIAGYSLDGKANATTQIIQKVARFFKIKELENFSVNLVPKQNVIELDLFPFKTLEEQLLQLHRVSYDITQDGFKLITNLKEFEQLRKAYPERREPKAYRCLLKNAMEETLRLGKELGFHLEKC